MSEKIDVLIPAYNSASFITKCVSSIQNQTYKDINIIIVDDGSKDNTYEVLSELAKNDLRIKLYQKENQKSVAKTRNFLLDKIESDYFIFVDSDDDVSPYYIEHLYKALKDNNAMMSTCEYSIFKAKKKKKIKGLKMFDSIMAIPEFILGKRGHFMLWNKLTATSLIKNIRFEEYLHFGEDMFFCLDIVRDNSFKIASIKNKLYHYKLSNGSSISKGGLNNSKKALLDQMIKAEQENRYANDTNALTTWIYITAKLYRVLARLHKKDKDYRPFLNQVIKDRKSHFKKDKRVKLRYRLLMKII